MRYTVGLHSNTTKKKAYKRRLTNRLHCYVERYEILATPINSNKFTKFDMKSKNSDLKIKHLKT